MKLLGLVTAALLVGCSHGRDGTTPIDGAVVVDLSAPPDLIAASADLAQSTGPLGCAGYVACLTSCGSNTSCAPACEARVTPAGHTLFDDGIGCGQAFCLDDTTVPARCVIEKGTGKLADPPGHPAGTCTACLTNALAALFGATCLPATSPDCNPSACGPTVSDCHASTP